MTLTRDQAQAAIHASTTRIYRRVDIYESDGETMWAENVGVKSGNVTVGLGDAVRRTLDLTLHNGDGELDSYPEAFWYDKIIKPYRGVIIDGEVWEHQLGEFMVDSFEEPHFPHDVTISGRDYGKKLQKSKFTTATSFEDAPVEDVIEAIAFVAGIPISRMNLATTGETTGKKHTFERGSERWQAINTIALAANHEVYFDSYGYMVLTPFSDPISEERLFTFQTGYTDPESGNLLGYKKKAHDTEICNHIVVVGTDPTTKMPVVGEAINTTPSSPTRVSRIGDRYWEYESTSITTAAKAQKLADSFLRVKALESFELSMTSLVVPWLDVGKVVEFLDPNPSPGDPSAFLLDSLSIPLGVGSMSSSGKRITIVG